LLRCELLSQDECCDERGGLGEKGCADELRRRFRDFRKCGLRIFVRTQQIFEASRLVIVFLLIELTTLLIESLLIE